MRLADTRDRLKRILGERIAVLDGAWGVLLQGRGLSEAEFRGERFAVHPRDLRGDPDLLNLTQPEIVSSIHRAYYEAGACMRGLVRAAEARRAGATNPLDTSAFGERLAARFARVSGVSVALPPPRG